MGQFLVRGDGAGGSLFLPRGSERRIYPNGLVIIREADRYGGSNYGKRDGRPGEKALERNPKPCTSPI